MGDRSHVSEREIDRLLAGNIAVDAPEDDLAGFVRDLRGAYLAPPSEATEARHLAAMAEEARVTADQRQRSPVRSRSEEAHRRPRARAFKEATVTRIRTATLAAKLAAATLVAALATGGVAAAISLDKLPDPFPGEGSSEDVHEAIIEGDPATERCAFGLRVADAASDGTGERPGAEACEQENANLDALVQRGKANSARGGGNANERANSARGGGDVGAQEHGGAHPDEGAGQAFGESVSGRATGGEPQDDGRAFGESVSEEAKQLVPPPEPQATPRGSRETGESASQQGQQTGGSASQDGRETAGGASGGRAP